MIKKTTSLTLAFSGLVLLATSVVLYLGPPSPVGHFSPWQFLGLSRHHWGAIHLNGGILFCIAMLVHTYYNWKPLLSYLKRKRTHGVAPLAVSLVMTLFVCTGSFHNGAPMKQVMGFARGLKMELVRQYGSPPYGTASGYPAAMLAGYMGWDPKAALGRLRDHRIVLASPKESLADIAANNHTTIGRLLDIMHGSPAPATGP